MLAVQGLVVGELVDHQAGDEADIRAAVLERALRDRRAVQAVVVTTLGELAYVLEDDVAAGPLGQPVGDLLADDLDGVRGQVRRFGIGNREARNRDA